VSEFDGNTLEAPIAIAVLTHIVRSIVDDADAVHVTSGRARETRFSWKFAWVLVISGVSLVAAVAQHKAFVLWCAQQQQTTMSMSTSISSTRKHS
jgi:hypothetical protein